MTWLRLLAEAHLIIIITIIIIIIISCQVSVVHNVYSAWNMKAKL